MIKGDSSLVLHSIKGVETANHNELFSSAFDIMPEGPGKMYWPERLVRSWASLAQCKVKEAFLAM